MAKSKQSQEFLGGGPKFNQVGRDNPPVAGADAPVVPVVQTGYWLRVAGIAVIVLALAGLLIYLNDRNLGQTISPHGSHATVSPDAPGAGQTDPNFK